MLISTTLRISFAEPPSTTAKMPDPPPDGNGRDGQGDQG